jgi:hypothetical protein
MIDEQKWFTKPTWLALGGVSGRGRRRGRRVRRDRRGRTAARRRRPGPPGEARRPRTDSICGLPPGNQDPVVGPPAGTSWTLIRDISPPRQSRGVGPGVIDGHDRRCFAHSALGAAVAAANAWRWRASRTAR